MDPDFLPGHGLNIDTARARSNVSGAISFKAVSGNPHTALGEVSVGNSEGKFSVYHNLLVGPLPTTYDVIALKKHERYSMLYKSNGRSEQNPILSISHYNAVPKDALKSELWNAGPFSGSMADENVWRRGALANKLSMMAVLEAVELFLDQGFPPFRTVYFALDYDEEAGGAEGVSAIVADWRGKGVPFEQNKGGSILGDVVSDVTHPASSVGVAEKGYWGLEVDIIAESDYSSVSPSQSAAGILASALFTLEQQLMPARYEVGMKLLFKYLTPHMGFMKQVVFFNDGLFEPMVVWSGVKGSTLSVEAMERINMGMSPADTSAEAVADMRGVVDGPKVVVRKGGCERGGFPIQAGELF